MLDALWVLQTLIADFGYAEVERYVLQHLRPLTTQQARRLLDEHGTP